MYIYIVDFLSVIFYFKIGLHSITKVAIGCQTEIDQMPNWLTIGPYTEIGHNHALSKLVIGQQSLHPAQTICTFKIKCGYIFIHFTQVII